jgi:hypothetical protein
VALIAKSIVTLKVEILRVEATEIAFKWLDKTGLEVAIKKSEVILITNKRTHNIIKVRMRVIEFTSILNIKKP